MARKTLLNESEIRKFLKLANITTVGNRKIQEMGGMPGGGAYDREEEEDEDPMGGAPAELEVGADELPAEGPLDAEEPEIGPEEDDLGVGDMDTAGREELMADVVRAVADALGIADRVDVEAGEEEAMDDMDAMGDEPLDLEPEAALAPEEGGEESLGEPVDLEDEEEEVPPMMEDEKNEELSEDDIVSEVARRVAKRLQDDSNKEAMVDNLAERILKRLTK